MVPGFERGNVEDFGFIREAAGSCSTRRSRQRRKAARVFPEPVERESGRRGPPGFPASPAPAVRLPGETRFKPFRDERIEVHREKPFHYSRCLRMKLKFLLPEEQAPATWLNVLPSLKEPLDPPVHPATHKPLTPDDLAPLFPMSLIEQEFSPKPEIGIPGEIMDTYALWRPTPLHRAARLERALDTPAHIYYKYEGTSPAGSHKPNTAVAQAYYNKQAGIRRLATETGAGQWGSALSLACRCSAWNARSTW